MIHLNTHKEKWRCKWNRLLFEHTLIKEKWNEDVNDVDDSFEHTLYQREMIQMYVNEVDDSFEHTLIKEKWRCKWSRWFIWTHIYQREMRCKLTRWFIWTHIYQGEIKM